MSRHWNHTFTQHSPIELENRLTVLEMTKDDHGRRITDLEGSRKPSITPRDWMMASAGVVMVIAALSEKIGWTHAIAGLVKLYGGR